MMSEERGLIETAARALARKNQEQQNEIWEIEGNARFKRDPAAEEDLLWKRYVTQAKCILEAIREPTTQMVVDGSDSIIDYLDGPYKNKYTGTTIYSAEAYAAWQRMIDTALGELSD